MALPSYVIPDKTVSIQVALPTTVNRSVTDIQGYYRDKDFLTSENKPHNKADVCNLLIQLGLQKLETLMIASEGGNPVTAFDKWRNLSTAEKRHWQKEVLDAIEQNPLNAEMIFESIENFRQIFFQPVDLPERYDRKPDRRDIAHRPINGTHKEVSAKISIYDTLVQIITERTKAHHGYYSLANFDVREQVSKVEFDYSHDRVWRDLHLQRKMIDEQIKMREQRLRQMPENATEEELYNDEVINVRSPKRNVYKSLEVNMRR